jgi:uncharacterized membrane protein (UPF0127 family)
MVYYKKKIFLILLLFIVVIALISLSFILYPVPAASNSNKNLLNSFQRDNISELKKGTLSINEKKINIEIASSDNDQYRGLSNRESLCDNCGMLFNFSDHDERTFVMRDMKFPLDIIFINDNKIINIASDLAPEGNKPTRTYSSQGKANRVLEVNGGYCDKNSIKVGDKISEPEINN